MRENIAPFLEQHAIEAQGERSQVSARRMTSCFASRVPTGRMPATSGHKLPRPSRETSTAAVQEAHAREEQLLSGHVDVRDSVDDMLEKEISGFLQKSDGSMGGGRPNRSQSQSQSQCLASALRNDGRLSRDGPPQYAFLRKAAATRAKDLPSTQPEKESSSLEARISWWRTQGNILRADDGDEPAGEELQGHSDWCQLSTTSSLASVLASPPRLSNKEDVTVEARPNSNEMLSSASLAEQVDFMTSDASQLSGHIQTTTTRLNSQPRENSPHSVSSSVSERSGTMALGPCGFPGGSLSDLVARQAQELAIELEAWKQPYVVTSGRLADRVAQQAEDLTRELASLPNYPGNLQQAACDVDQLDRDARGTHQQLDEMALADHGQESCGERQFTGKEGDHTPVTALPETPSQDSGLASGSDEVWPASVSECTPTADLPQVARRLEFVSGSPIVGASQTRSPVGRLTPQVVVCRATGSPPWQAEDSSGPARTHAADIAGAWPLSSSQAGKTLASRSSPNSQDEWPRCFPSSALPPVRWLGEQEPPHPESSALEVPDEYSAALDVVAAHARGGRVTMTELRSLLSSSHSAFASWLVGVRQWYRFADLSGRIGLDDLRTAIEEFRSVDTGVQKARRAPIASVSGGNGAGVSTAWSQSAIPLLPSFVENTAPASFPSEGVNDNGCHHDPARATAALDGDSPLQEIKVGEQAKVRGDALRQRGFESDEAEGMGGCSQPFALDYEALEGKISDANLHTGSCEKEPLRKETAWLKPGASRVSALDWASALENRVSGSAAMHAKALLQGLRDEAPRGPAGTWTSSQACRRQLLES